MRRVIPNKVCTSARDRLPPIACMLLEHRLFGRVDLSADDTGEHGLGLLLLCACLSCCKA
jgi:hypothetical protein